MKAAKLGAAAVIAIAGIVLFVLSIIQRDAGVFWMPIMFFIGLILELVAVILVTYDDKEAVAVRKQMDELAQK